MKPEDKTGLLQAISLKNSSAKIDDTWYDVPEEVMKFLKNIPKDSEVIFNSKPQEGKTNNLLSFIKKSDRQSEAPAKEQSAPIDKPREKPADDRMENMKNTVWFQQEEIKNRSTAISYAKDLVIGDKLKRHEIFVFADAMAKYIMTGKKPVMRKPDEKDEESKDPEAIPMEDIKE